MTSTSRSSQKEPVAAVPERKRAQRSPSKKDALSGTTIKRSVWPSGVCTKTSPEFRDRYRFRAGIEGTMSQLDRLTGIKNLRVRGMSAVSFAAYLKAAGINIIRAAAYRNRENRRKTGSVIDPFPCYLVLSKSDCSAFQRPPDVGAAFDGRICSSRRFMPRDFLRDHHLYIFS